MLQDDFELANTQKKLSELEARYDAHKRDTSEDERVRELSMRSLKKLINQLKEEIARYEAGLPTKR